MLDKNDVKNLVSIEAVLRHFGFKVGPSNKNMSCPFHEDINPSFRIYGKRFKCFSCNRRGDVIDLVKELSSEEMNLNEILDYLNNEFDLGLAPTKDLSPQQRRFQRELKRKRDRYNRRIKAVEDKIIELKEKERALKKESDQLFDLVSMIKKALERDYNFKVELYGPPENVAEEYEEGVDKIVELQRKALKLESDSWYYQEEAMSKALEKRKIQDAGYLASD